MEGTLKASTIVSSMVNRPRRSSMCSRPCLKGINPSDVLNEGMVKAMAEVGRLFRG